MSNARFSSFHEAGDLLYQQRTNQIKTQQQQVCQNRKITGGGMNGLSRTFSTGAESAFVPVAGRTSTTPSQWLTPGSSLMSPMESFSPSLSSREHKKLDRSMSEPIGDRLDKSSPTNVNSSRYKTELCRTFEENGHCKYGDKCQFAHGGHEMRNLSRHPKYKTDLCRTFHTIGFCPYGPRCHFVHNEDERNVGQAPTKSQQPIERPSSIHFSSMSSVGSSLDSPPSSDSDSPSPTFFTEDIFSTCSIPYSSGCGSSRSSPSFAYNCISNVGCNQQNSVITPLNVQTHLNNLNTAFDLSCLQTQFSNLNLTLSEQNNNNNTHQIEFEDNFLYRDSNRWSTCNPPSPESESGDSVGSSAGGSTNVYSTCGSPLELGKNLRLPIFNRLSQETN